MNMNVLFIYPNKSGDNLIPLGLSLISTSLKKSGHKVKLFDTTYIDLGNKTGDQLREEKLQVRKTNRERFILRRGKVDIHQELKKIITEFNPQVIGLSVFEISYRFGMDLLKKAKELSPNSYTIVGGLFATFSPELIIQNEYVDAVCMGEGEDALVDYCNAIEKNQDTTHIQNLWVKKEDMIYKNPLRELKPLDELPFQDWEIYDKQHLYKPMGGKMYKMGAFELSRGCFYSCAFCCNSQLRELYKGCGKYHREKSISKLREEIRYFKDKYDIKYIYFNDEAFLSMSEQRFDSFVDMYKEFKLPFFIAARADSITEARVQKLKEIGCEGICMGVESGNDYIRNEVLGKNVKKENIIKAYKIIRKYRIRSSASNIIGLPYETRKQIFDTIKLNRHLKTDSVCANTFSPYRGSKLRDVAVKEGYIHEDFIADDYRANNFIQMPQISVEELQGLQRAFPLYVYFPMVFWPLIWVAEKNDAVFKILSNLFTKIKWRSTK